jgi:hypothetical protein
VRVLAYLLGPNLLPRLLSVVSETARRETPERCPGKSRGFDMAAYRGPRGRAECAGGMVEGDRAEVALLGISYLNSYRICEVLHLVNTIRLLLIVARALWIWSIHS